MFIMYIKSVNLYLIVDLIWPEMFETIGPELVQEQKHCEGLNVNVITTFLHGY